MDKNKTLSVLVVGVGEQPETFIKNLISGLVEKNVNVTLCTPRRKTKGSAREFKNLTFLWNPPWGTSDFVSLIRMLCLIISRFSFKRLTWLISQSCDVRSVKEKFIVTNRYSPFLRGHWDLIYFPWNSTAMMFKGLYQLGCPAVVSCRGSQVNIRPHCQGQEDFFDGLKYTLENASAVHGVSSAILSEVQKLGIVLQISKVIFPAVDPAFFLPLSNEKNQKNGVKLVSTGSINWKKGFEYLLIALRQFLDCGHDAELHIIGEGPETDRLLFTINDLYLNKNVILHGRLKPSAVLEQLQGADIFVLSSVSEGISNAVLEAMSCGLPVVTSDCGGMGEAIEDGVEGFLVPPRDPDAMCKALWSLADSKTLREQMGLAGRRRILQNHNINDQIEQFINLFQLAQKS